MTVRDNTIQAERLSELFKNLGKKRFIASKKWQNFYQETWDERWIIEQTLLVQLLLETPKQFYQHFQR